MSNRFKFINYDIRGIKCDACDWKDENISLSNYKHYVNCPCPKCGANILTETDFKTTNNIVLMSKIINVFAFPIHFPLYLISKKYRAKFITNKIEMDGTGKVEIKVL